jgi:molybdenum cofactor cytidylyltransferase
MMAKLAAVLLAAGASTRYGPENKLLVQLNGRPLVRGVAEAVLHSGVAEVVAVTGYDEARIKDALAGLPLRLVSNVAWEEGMGSSIAAGVGALAGDVAAAFIVPGDMPNLDAGLLQTLSDTFESDGRGSIVYPTTPDGEQRNPVLWPARYFAQLAALTGAQGGKALLSQHAGDCIRVVLASEAACADVDTPADLAAAQGALPQAHRR